MNLYFASKPINEIGEELIAKVETYDRYLQTSGIFQELKKSYDTYYGNSSITSAGTQQHLKKIHVNEYHSLINNIISLVCAQRPAWEPRATNSDRKSQSQCILSSGILDYYMRELHIERDLKRALESALYLREGWLSITWQTELGEAIAADTETNMPIKEGDIEINGFQIQNVIRDVTAKSSKLDWLITRRFVNKYDLANKYPELADKIVNIQNNPQVNELAISKSNEKESDLIPLYNFFHNKTASVPAGRFIEFIDSEIITFDGALPYRRVPLYRVAVSDLENTPFGHTHMFNCLPLNDVLDMLWSTATTNISAFGVSNILNPRGNGITVNSIQDGLRLIEFDPKLGSPEVLNLLQTSPEVFNFMNMVKAQQESLSGLNNVARGNASPQLSGAAMSLLASMAIQQNSNIQNSYLSLLEDIGTAIIHNLADFSKSKRVSYIVGKNSKSYLKEFDRTDIESISRVTVDSASALSKTVAGRTELANNLLQTGQIDAERYLEVVQTGNLSPVTEAKTAKMQLIRDENEKLMEGISVNAVLIENHALHIDEHSSVLASVEAKSDPNVVQAVLTHIQEHLDLAQNMSPQLMAVLGYQPLPPVTPQMNQQVLSNQNPISEQGAEVQQPSMPNNPLNGQEFDPNNNKPLI